MLEIISLHPERDILASASWVVEFGFARGVVKSS
jgi:hypothetical protein